jgi:SET and MYND domain-containing protein
MLLRTLKLKTYCQAQRHLENLKKFNSEVMQMVSMASQTVHTTDKSKLATYAMICMLRCPEMAVDIQSFRLIIHLYSLLDVNGFGVSAARSQVRVATGLYWPSNLIDHSCAPNAVVVYRGRTQFIIALNDIPKGAPVNISYIDQAMEDAASRQ